ncbi:MAG: ABC transporter ATP-binding protein/permease [Bacilli bacterium]|nr:ABC transporter ATP-binding protein/permease [Bacilli bacterium]
MGFFVAKGISKFYKAGTGGVHALRKCSLSFPSKGLIAIKGKSGSGKSTLLNILAGIEKPTTGTVFFGGKKANEKGPLLDGRAGMVFQHYDLIAGESVLRNVSLPLSMRGKGNRRAKKLLRDFGLGAFAHKDVATLSGGEKQRVAICRALVHDPRVVFADEPTGALDEKNGIAAMDMLRAIGNYRLVIVVSHNEELIQRYADAVIEIADGVVKTPLLVQSAVPVPKASFRRSSTWLPRFIFRNIRRNLLKDVVCLLSGIVGFSSLLLSIGFFAGNEVAFEEEQTHSLLYPYSSISERTVIEVPGSKLTLIKKTRPSATSMTGFATTFASPIVVDDLAYFFPASMTYETDGQNWEPVSFSPVWDITLETFGKEMVTQGELPRGEAFNECVVNEEFAHRHGGKVVGKVLSVNQRCTVQLEGKTHEVFVEAELIVRCVVKEFGFLNSPRVYYSYPRLEKALEGLPVGGGESNARELVAWAESDSPYSNYSSLLFLQDPNDVARLFEWMEQGDESLDVACPSYVLRSSFHGLSQAFTMSLSLFVGIAVLGLCLILGMSSLSSFVSGKKESAVLMVLGAKRSQVFSIYVAESALLCFLSAGASLLVCPLLERLFNGILRGKFDVSSIIRIPYQTLFGLPFSLIWGCLLIALVLGGIAAALPMAFHRRIPLSEELRDE